MPRKCSAKGDHTKHQALLKAKRPPSIDHSVETTFKCTQDGISSCFSQQVVCSTDLFISWKCVRDQILQVKTWCFRPLCQPLLWSLSRGFYSIIQIWQLHFWVIISYYHIHSNRCPCPHRCPSHYIIKLLWDKNKQDWWFFHQEYKDL